jgi:hypothetical protein
MIASSFATHFVRRFSQVRQMLIKSRAVGEKRVRSEDRFYLEVIFLDGEDSASSSTTDASSYRFFSRLAAAGRVADLVDAQYPGRRDEDTLEILAKDEGTGELRRIPNTAHLNDLEKKSKVMPFSRVVVRRVKPGDDLTDPLELS